MSYPVRLPASAPVITLTHPKPSLWIIELHNGQDSRLTTDLINNGLKPALNVVEKEWRKGWRAAQEARDQDGGKGALIIVGRRDQEKFFSNDKYLGLDHKNAILDQNFLAVTFNPLLARLLTFPIPTVAAINGHTFAAGFILSLACDYRVMTDGSRRNAWLCMNEVHFGAAWPLSFATILREKVGDLRLQRKIALEGHKFAPTEAYEAGLVDHLVPGNTADVLAKAEEVAIAASVNGRTGVWGLIKCDLYRDALEMIGRDLRITNPAIEDAAARSRL